MTFTCVDNRIEEFVATKQELQKHPKSSECMDLDEIFEEFLQEFLDPIADGHVLQQQLDNPYIDGEIVEVSPGEFPDPQGELFSRSGFLIVDPNVLDMDTFGDNDEEDAAAKYILRNEPLEQLAKKWGGRFTPPKSHKN